MTPHVLLTDKAGDITVTATPTLTNFNVKNEDGSYSRFNQDGTSKSVIGGSLLTVNAPTTFSQSVHIKGEDVHTTLMDVRRRVGKLEQDLAATNNRRAKFVDCASHSTHKVIFGSKWSRNSDLGRSDRNKHDFYPGKYPLECPDGKVLKSVAPRWGVVNGHDRMWWTGKCCRVEWS
jgi:hypothetical protein